MKETIIFLHGITGNKNAFKTEYEALQGEYHCTWYDFPGYGEDSLGEDVPFSLDILVEQLYQHYETENITCAHICTLSFGCLPALAFAYQYPEKVKSLTFSGGYCNVPSSFQNNLIRLFEEKENNTYLYWLENYAKLQNPNKKEIPEDSESIFFSYGSLLHPNVFEKAARIQLEFESEKILKNIKQPVLWVMGEYDDLYKGTLYDVKKWIPQVAYRELKGAGHVAHIHQPEQFMKAFRSFLSKL